MKELHAGIFLEDVAPEAIRRSIQMVLEQQELKDGATAIRQSFLKCGGASEAADFIEKHF